MCGITGWINLENKPSQNGEAVLHSMCERIKHRGPDSEGLWVGMKSRSGCGGFRSLICTRANSRFISEDKSVVVVMNGELYNFREVRAIWKSADINLKHKTDTEILPHLYEEYGEAMLEHINGMFAFALWDKNKKKLLIARDKFGEKPLYYGIFDGKLIFASEPKVLLANPRSNRK